ncbi:MAG: Stk1 family PASTA domain-containing Ser/Thr kinase [Ruminococcus sp.]|nr:Stk1 family PASTA domain-containing Ser/Thr kinase [Ruminococcus sp.]
MNYIGKRLDDRYEITEQIGSGGMADVYKAQDLADDRTVAVKILRDEYSQNEEFLRRFRNESKAIAVLSHPNIVKIYDVGLTDDTKFIVMEYVNGITMKDYIEQEGVLRWKYALFFLTQILRALQHAHDKGIVHRDIKPQNIMLLDDGTIKVMDFGIARFSRVDGKTLSDKTVGSVHYISPEQARGDMTDERSDIYSVGVMMYEMLTGKKPYDGESPVAIALKHMQENCPLAREIMPSIPEALEEITYHAMEKDPSRRYQSAADMIKDLDTFKLDPTVEFGYTDPNYTPEVVNSNPYPNPYIGSTSQLASELEEQFADDEDDDYEDYEEEEEVAHRSYVVPIMLAVTVAVVIIAALVIAYYAISNFGISSTHTGSVEIPNFVGQNIVQVEQEYGDVLNFEKEEEYSSEYDEGIIIAQDQTGKTVKEGYTLKVTVSKGQKLITVPDLANKDEDIVRSELTSAGFVPVRMEAYDDDVPEGTVIKTEPEAGTEYPEGKEVQYYVSQGPLETQVKVPDVTGLTESKAIAALKENKLSYEVEEVKQDGDKGKVVDQSIDPDTYVDKETVVTIYVSTGEADPIDLTLVIQLPTGIRGSYTIDVYREGSVAYTKTISNGEAVAGGTVSFDISGKNTETLTVYIKSNDLGEENLIRYATYKIDYDNETITLDGELNEDDLLKITPAESTTTTTTAAEESSEETTAATTTATDEAATTAETDAAA